MSQLLNLADNPLFVKHVRARLRKGTLLPSFILIGFVCLCLIWADRNIAAWKNENIGPIFFFALQALLLGLMGGSQIATSVAYVRESGILDFHRVTPVSPKRQVLGFLLGAPIREWLLFAFTVPFAFVCSMLGNWGVTNFAKLLLVQITTALFYHTLAVVTGLSGKAKGASGRLVGTILFIQIGAAYFYFGGVYGPAFVTSIPVLREAIEDARLVAGGQPPRDRFDPRFFDIPLPAIVQTLGFQLSIGAFLFIAATRRFRSARMPVFSKPQALALMSVLTFLTLGSAWNWPSMALVLTLSYLLCLTGVWLSAPVTPPLGEYYKGLQRAHKRGSSHAPMMNDLASNQVTILAYGFIFLGAGLLALLASPFGAVKKADFLSWAPLTVGVLTILGFGWGLQYFHLKYAKRALIYFNMLIFFFWIAPLLVGALFRAAGITEAGYIAAVSPVFGIFYSSQAGAQALDTNLLLTLSIVPSALMTLYYGWGLMRMEARRRREVLDEHRPAELTTQDE